MRQISLYIEEEQLKLVGKEAEKQNRSRNQQIIHMLNFYFSMAVVKSERPEEWQKWLDSLPR